MLSIISTCKMQRLNAFMHSYHIHMLYALNFSKYNVCTNKINYTAQNIKRKIIL